MRIDQDAAQTLHPVFLDETHPAHISRQVVNLDRAFRRSAAVVALTQVQRERLNTWNPLVPFH